MKTPATTDQIPWPQSNISHATDELLLKLFKTTRKGGVAAG